MYARSLLGWIVKMKKKLLSFYEKNQVRFRMHANEMKPQGVYKKQDSWRVR